MVAKRAQVTVTVLRGSRVVKRFAARRAAADRTYRLSLPARGLARGDYKVRLVARAGCRDRHVDAGEPSPVSGSAISTSST